MAVNLRTGASHLVKTGSGHLGICATCADVLQWMGNPSSMELIVAGVSGGFSAQCCPGNPGSDINFDQGGFHNRSWGLTVHGESEYPWCYHWKVPTEDLRIPSCAGVIWKGYLPQVSLRDSNFCLYIDLVGFVIDSYTWGMAEYKSEPMQYGQRAAVLTKYYEFIRGPSDYPQPDYPCYGFYGLAVQSTPLSFPETVSVSW